jgi:acetyl-CoA C-acetyltransferase
MPNQTRETYLRPQDPVEFTTAPSDAIPRALSNARVSLKDIDYHEINEAFAVVALANMKVDVVTCARQMRLHRQFVADHGARPSTSECVWRCCGTGPSHWVRRVLRCTLCTSPSLVRLHRCSGARILGTLYSVLKDKDATLGCASICNGGGAASAVVIERLN